MTAAGAFAVTLTAFRQAGAALADLEPAIAAALLVHRHGRSVRFASPGEAATAAFAELAAAMGEAGLDHDAAVRALLVAGQMRARAAGEAPGAFVERLRDLADDLEREVLEGVAPWPARSLQ